MTLRTHLRRREEEDAPASEPQGGGAPPAAPARPEGLPDEYWDAEKGVKFDALLPQLQAHNEYLAKVATKPEDIDWSLPTDLDPDNPDIVYEVDKSDPLLAEVAKIAVEERVSKPFLNKIAGAYARQEIAKAKAAREALAAEEKKLGDKFVERIEGARAYVESVVGKEKADRFRNTWVTAEQVEVIEALAKKAAGPVGAATHPTTTPNADDPQRKAAIFFGKKD